MSDTDIRYVSYLLSLTEVCANLIISSDACWPKVLLRQRHHLHVCSPEATWPCTFCCARAHAHTQPSAPSFIIGIVNSSEQRPVLTCALCAARTPMKMYILTVILISPVSNLVTFSKAKHRPWWHHHAIFTVSACYVATSHPTGALTHQVMSLCHVLCFINEKKGYLSHRGKVDICLWSSVKYQVYWLR